jgi:hypothetical protein
MVFQHSALREVLTLGAGFFFNTQVRGTVSVRPARSST